MKLHSALNLTLDGGWGPDSSLMAIFPPGKEPLICIEWETLWSPDPVWTIQRREKSLVPARNWFSSLQPSHHTSHNTLATDNSYVTNLNLIIYSQAKEGTKFA